MIFATCCNPKTRKNWFSKVIIEILPGRHRSDSNESLTVFNLRADWQVHSNVCKMSAKKNSITPTWTEPYHIESNRNPTESNRIESCHFPIEPSWNRIRTQWTENHIESSFVDRCTPRGRREKSPSHACGLGWPVKENINCKNSSENTKNKYK